MSLPLWRILLKARRNEATLTCDECFALMEHFADRAASGVDMGKVRRTAARHLAHCPDCREHHLQRLREIEARHKAEKRGQSITPGETP